MALDNVFAATSAGDADASTTSPIAPAHTPSPAALKAPHSTLTPPPLGPEQRPLADPHGPVASAESDSKNVHSTSGPPADNQTEVSNTPVPREASPASAAAPTGLSTDAVARAPPQDYIHGGSADTHSPSATAHAQLQNGDAGSSASPTMSQGQQGSEIGRSLTAYGHSSSTYASPGAQSGGYLYPSVQSPVDAYRASPGTPISLPSVKTFDPLSQQTQQQLPPPQQHQQQQQQQQQGSHVPVQHHLQHQQPQAMHLPSSASHAPALSSLLPHGYMPMPPQNPYMFPPDPAAQRYAIPPHADPRFRGPKKEIKRRTKTGCLTCRKRRIKCDEAQPTCNNCKKSKRDCLGYDPIFKSQQGPSTLQVVSSTKGLVSAPTLPSSIPSAPLPSSNPYGSQPAVLPSSYGSQAEAAQPQTFDPVQPTVSPPVKGESYEYSQAVDPALHGLPSLSSPAPVAGHQFGSGMNSHLRAKKMKVEEIISLLGPMPDVQAAALTDDLFKEIVRVYHEVYVQGLNNFFETEWFSHKDQSGMLTFPNEPSVVNVFAAFLHLIQRTQPTNHSAMVSSGVLEARLVWALATLPYVLCPASSNAAATMIPHPADGIEARNRVLVIQTLLNGDSLTDNPLARPTNDPQNLRNREFHFWYTLAEYLRCGDDRSPPMGPKREEQLGHLRRLLDGRENRDLLYSIAIARDLSPLVEPGYEQTVPQHHDESNPKNKLFVASNFIRQEAQVAGGTTNVVRRLSEIAIQAFIHPGVNIAKLPMV